MNRIEELEKVMPIYNKGLTRKLAMNSEKEPSLRGDHSAQYIMRKKTDDRFF